MIELWMTCRAGDMGDPGRLPDDGGAADQSPFVLGCFAVLESAVKGFASKE